EVLHRRRLLAAEHEQRAVRRIAECTGQQEQAALVRIADEPQVRLAERQPTAAEIGHDVIGEREESHQYVTGGSICSMLARFGSSQGGSLSARPSDDRSSSTVNPGAVVATSNSTPPGSRK